MASDDEHDFGDDVTRTDSNRNSVAVNYKETSHAAETATILHLRERLRSCEDTLATCQVELETSKSNIHKWISSFQNKFFIPAGCSPEPRYVINFLEALKSSEESIRYQLDRAKKKETALLLVLAKREKEIAELKAAVRDLKAQLNPPSFQTRRLLLDPAIHGEFTRLKSLIEEKDKKLNELQENLAATSSSKDVCKMLMDKCRVLQEENEVLGDLASEGKIHELEMKLALQKSINIQLRTHYEALHKHMEMLVNDVERGNELVFILREKLASKVQQQQPKNPVVEKQQQQEQPKHESLLISEKADDDDDDVDVIN